MQRQWAAVFASCVVLVGACVGSGSTRVAADPPAPPPDPACYRQSDLDNRTWDRLDWEEQSCFAESSCNGGLGGSSAGCLKWARGPDAPALPWSAEVTADAPAGRPLPTDEGLPLERGLWASHTICDGSADTCRVVRWRATARVLIYAEPDPTSRRVGRLNPNEIVVGLEHARFFAAMRGIVVEAYNGMNAGDVVYAVEDVCKGHTVWRRGDLIEGIDGGVDWEPRQRLNNPSGGAWVRFERANGQRGWARASVLGAYLTNAEPPPPQPVTEASEFDEFDECE